MWKKFGVWLFKNIVLEIVNEQVKDSQKQLR